MESKILHALGKNAKLQECEMLWCHTCSNGLVSCGNPAAISHSASNSPSEKYIV